MCMPHTCSTCNGKTWTGCGMHVARVMDAIPKDEWCKCTAESTKDGKVVEEGYPPGGKGGCVIM
ncbi:hypothetical protein EX30DRAFT_344484 [Ascodesmis nigricans]|uniref:Uncharacterized protein n=1 Tax=Ascodesmis nigricans TaxID=341454 RepID=A0A4S2MJ08_9PEZI|nr:hypothetical protein EX30DRAFT_344484 [Ascodesmis nigricans]